MSIYVLTCKMAEQVVILNISIRLFLAVYLSLNGQMNR